ncbi:hypothetical protein ACO0LG_08595 [Undibacterium sp. Ji42W]|uniref:hypothetical protein n=1 Tax=Undibacterium sp. Ji42W TaxID=3413039 RepID=UPI003BF0541D
MADTWHTGTPPERGLYLRLIHGSRAVYAMWDGRRWYGYTAQLQEAEDSALRNNVSDYQSNSMIEWQKAGAEHE